MQGALQHRLRGDKVSPVDPGGSGDVVQSSIGFYSVFGVNSGISKQRGIAVPNRERAGLLEFGYGIESVEVRADGVRTQVVVGVDDLSVQFERCHVGYK